MAFYTFDEFVDLEIEDPLYIIDPIFLHKGTMCLHAQQTSGKSQLTLGMLCAIARGERFLGKYKTAQGSVGYIQYDLPPKAWQDRQQRVSKMVRGLPFYNVVDFGYHNVRTWKQGGKLNPPYDISQLAERKPSIVAVDSVARCHNLNENESSTVRLVYDTFHEIFEDSSLVAVHHHNKDSNTGFKQNESNRARGSTAWLDDANAGISIQRLRRGKGGPLNAKITFTKTPQCEEPKPMKITIDPNTLLLTPSELTSRDAAEIFVEDNPEITRHGFVEAFANGVSGITLGKTQAYELAKEFNLE